MTFMARWGLLSQAERDAAYNNSAHVADSAVLNAAREVASSAFRAGQSAASGPALRQAGARHAGTCSRLADPDAPCIVFIHGGYWQRNSKDQFANLIAGPHARGWAAALPGYTLAPDASLTEIVAEINAALDWLAAHGPAHGINGPIVLSGWSAGGHLTAMCLGHPLVKAGLAISGVFELGPIRDTYLNEKLRLTEDGDRFFVADAAAAGGQASGVCLRYRGVAAAGVGQPRPARPAFGGASAGGADSGAAGEPFHNRT